MPTEKLKDNPVLENETDDVLKEIKDLEDELDIEIVEDEEEPPKAPDAPEDDEGDEDEEEGDEDEDEDEDDEDEDEDEDDDEEEDLKQYSKNVQKRIRREVKLRKQAENAIRMAAQQRNMVGQIAQKEHQEKNSLQEKYDNLEDQYVTLLENSMSSGLEMKQQQLIQARDEGDTAAEIRLQSELDDMRMHKRQLDDYKSTMQVTREQRKQPPQQNQEQQQPNPKAVDYLKKNMTWMKSPENAPAVAYLQTLDNQVLQEGFDPDSDEYYKEVDKRLKAAFPNLGKKKTRKRRNSSKKGSAAPAAPVAAEGASKPRNDGKIRLTKTDLDNMRAFGMDPENKDHLKAYAQQKVN
jgi:hypothetical protein